MLCGAGHYGEGGSNGKSVIVGSGTRIMMVTLS